MKTCFSEGKLMKQFGNPPFQPPISEQFLWPPFFVQILKTKESPPSPHNFKGGEETMVIIHMVEFINYALWYFSNLNILHFLKKKLKENDFLANWLNFILFYTLPKILKSIFWWNEVENQKLQTFVFKMRYCTWCGHIAQLNFV